MSCGICWIWGGEYIFRFWHSMHPPQHFPWNTNKFWHRNPLSSFQKAGSGKGDSDCKSLALMLEKLPCFSPSLMASSISSVRSQSVKLIRRPNKRKRTDIWEPGFHVLFRILSWPQSEKMHNFENMKFSGKLQCSLRPRSQSASIIQRINREMGLKTFLCPPSLAR